MITAIFSVAVLILAGVVFLQDKALRKEQAIASDAIELARESRLLLEKSIDARDNERQAWAAERQQLLDRIQAPSFAEYKQAEVRTIKAQNGAKEPPPLEQL